MSMKAKEAMSETWEGICKLEALLWQVDGLNSTEDPDQQERQAWLISMAYDEVLRLKKFVGSIEYSKL